MAKQLDPRAQAIASQLSAEIARSRWRSVRAFTRALNDAGHPTDYTTLYRRTKGQAQIPMGDLLPMLDLLGVPFEQFVNDAMDWLRRQPTSDPAHEVRR